jgi:O-antigen/teichoic acid export membrane protein
MENSPGGIGGLAWDTSAYALAVAVAPLTALLTTPVLARYLGPSGFGMIDVFVALLTVASIVAFIGMDSAAARSYFSHPPEETDKRRKVLATAVRATAVTSILVAVGLLPVVLIVGQWVTTPDYASTAIAAVAALPLTNVQVIGREIFRLMNRKRWYALSTLVSAGGGAFIGIALVALGAGPAGYFLGLGAGAAAALAGTFVSERRIVAAPLDRAELAAMLRFGLPLVPASVSVWALFLIDRMLVAAFQGSHDVGLYSLANKATSPILFGAQALIAAWLPFALRLHASAPHYEPHVRGQTLTYVAAFVGTAVAALTLFARPVVILLGGDDFAAAAAAVPALALAWAAYTASVVLATPFSLERRTGLASIVASISACVNIALNLVLIPRFGFEGAAWATTASFVLLAALYGGVSTRVSPLRLEPFRLAAVAGIAVAGVMTGAVVGGSTLVRGGCAIGVAIASILVAATRRPLRLGGRSVAAGAER